MTQAPVEDPRIATMYYRAMSVLTPAEQEAAILAGTKKYAEVIKEEDTQIMEQGFLIFGKAPAAKRKEVFLTQTAQSDIWRCLLTEAYLDEYRQGAPPPDSPMWRTLLMVGGEHWFLHFRREFIRAWNQTARSLGFTEDIYHAGQSSGQQDRGEEDGQGGGPLY